MLDPGAIIGGDFKIVRPLSQGGMGTVFVAEQLSTARLRALKVMKTEIVPDPAMRRRFELEAKIGSQIDSEHIVQVIAAGFDEPIGAPWLAMELLEGGDLEARLRRGPLSTDEAAEIFAQIGNALEKAHAVNIVHRDLKPENIFLARRSDGKVFVKVLDFGIARRIDVRASTTQAGLGTPMYMAPEQASPGTPITPATDVWALGLIAFECLAGTPFWKVARDPEATHMMLAMEAFVHPMPRASERLVELGGSVDELPDGFDAWFAKAVNRDPKQRFATGGVAVRALLAILNGREESIDRDTIAAPTKVDDGSVPAPAILQQTGQATLAARKPSRTSGCLVLAAVLTLGGVAAAFAMNLIRLDTQGSGQPTTGNSIPRTTTVYVSVTQLVSAPAPPVSNTSTSRKTATATETASAIPPIGPVAPAESSVPGPVEIQPSASVANAPSSSVATPSATASAPAPSASAAASNAAASSTASVAAIPTAPANTDPGRPCIEQLDTNGDGRAETKQHLDFTDAPATCTAPPELLESIQGCPTKRELSKSEGRNEYLKYEDGRLVEKVEKIGKTVTRRIEIKYAANGAPLSATRYDAKGKVSRQVKYTRQKDGTLLVEELDSKNILKSRSVFTYENNRVIKESIDRDANGSEDSTKIYEYTGKQLTLIKHTRKGALVSSLGWLFDCPKK